MQHKLLGLTQASYVFYSLSVSQQFKIQVFWITHHLEVLVNIGISEQCAASIFNFETG
jgi:hypothetical protein